MRFRQLGTGWIQPYTIHPESTRSETAETASQSVRGMSETINRQKDSHMHTRLHTHAYTRIHTNGTRAHTLAESMAPAHSTTSPPARCCDEASAVCVCVCVCVIVYVCVYTHTYACVCVCAYTHIHTHARTHTHTHRQPDVAMRRLLKSATPLTCPKPCAPPAAAADVSSRRPLPGSRVRR